MRGQAEVGEVEQETMVSPPTAAPTRVTKERFKGRRAKKPKQIALVMDGCTGCAGGPVCQTYCPVEECMILQPVAEVFPFARVWVDPLRCVGCRKCVRQGSDGMFVDGCPWDAIVMIPTREWEDQHGQLPY